MTVLPAGLPLLHGGGGARYPNGQDMNVGEYSEDSWHLKGLGASRGMDSEFPSSCGAEPVLTFLGTVMGLWETRKMELPQLTGAYVLYEYPPRQTPTV